MLAVGLVAGNRPVMFQWALGLALQQYPTNIDITYLTRQINPERDKWAEISRCREEIAVESLSIGASHLWLLDDDIQPSAEAARRLWTILEQNPDAGVVGAICPTKTVPSEPVVYVEDGNGPHWRWKFGDVFDCSSVGTGCMMIRTSIFRSLQKPWFEYTDRRIKLVGGNGIEREIEGEDVGFCRKVRQAGFRVMADGGSLCIHWCCRTGVGYFLPQDSYPLRKDKVEAVN